MRSSVPNPMAPILRTQDCRPATTNDRTGLFAALDRRITLGGIYFGQQLVPEPSADGTVAQSHVRYNNFKTDLFAIPYVNETGIVGYVTGRFTVKTVASEEAAMQIP
jgi:hypothetical protein